MSESSDVAFDLILRMLKLFVSQYSIELSSFGKAGVAALILGKVVPLLDWAQSGDRFDTHRLAVVIGAKTVINGLFVIISGIGEDIFHGARGVGNPESGFNLP